MYINNEDDLFPEAVFLLSDLDGIHFSFVRSGVLS